MKRIVLRKDFQKKIFERLLDKFSRQKLEKTLGVNSASIYHMKNYKIRSLNEKSAIKISRLLNLPKNEVKKNTLRVLSEKEAFHGLEIGRQFRKNQLEKWRREIPQLEDLIENNLINVEKWFQSYVKLINFGSRQINSIEKDGNKLILKYTNYSNGEKKEFTTNLPRKIRFDDEFVYFFGLWCGDKAGGGRLGVANKSSEINLITEYHLKKLYQRPIFQMLLSSRLNYSPLPNVRVDGVWVVKNMPGDYVIVVFAINSIFKKLFVYLLKNLDEFLSVITNKNVFFAGLFDAEGNVALEDKYFRWSCKNERQIEIYKKHLTDLNLFKRYDGASLITDNREVFLEKIYPYINHKAKINRIKLLFFNEGFLENRFKNILICIDDNPGKTVQQLNAIFMKKKIWPQLKFLHQCSYLRREGYPMKLYITDKGLKEIGRQGR